MNHTRRKVTLAFTIIAGVLALASVAYACIPFKGSLTVTPLATGRTAGNTVTGDGTANNLGYCTANPDGRPTSAGVAAGGEQITVAVAAASCGGTSYQLPQASDYSVIINNSNDTDATFTPAPFRYDGTRWNITANTGCFFGGGAPAGNITLGNANFNVGSTGSGNATYTLPTMNVTNTTSDASMVCVGKSGGSGIFAPLRIVAI